ncbi:MAG: DUF4139 domain-containing protein [Rhodobacteraceae bacterium]|nr:DUF4139 domain-containing protein [Paracoccaceae bacterium]
MLKYILPIPLCLISSLAMAETFTLSSTVSAVTVYPVGALVTRDVAFDLPAGRHELVLVDVPEGAWINSLQIFGGDGLVFGATGSRRDRLPPDDREIAARAEIEAQIDALNADILLKQQESAAVQLRINASNARLRFLETIGRQQAGQAGGALENGALSIETLTAMVELVGSESLGAMQEAHQAQIEIAALTVVLTDMHEELKDLHLALNAAGLPPYPRQMVTFDVQVSDNVSGVFQISYLDAAGRSGWRPVYDVYLDTDSGEMRIHRKATVIQYTGEVWQNAAISLSTARPSFQTQLDDPRGHHLRYTDPVPPRQEMRAAAADMYIAPSVVMIEEPARIAGGGMDFQGANALYHLPDGTTIAGDGSEVLVSINSVVLTADLTAQVNLTRSDSPTFLIAEFTNSSNQIILPGNFRFYRDGAYHGSEDLNILVAPGVTETLGFGIIDGIDARRITRKYEDGQSGVLTTSNERIEEYELVVENRSGRTWDIVAYGRVPYSEQEDLEIDYSSRPRPTVVDFDDTRGVLAWQFSLGDGETQSIALEYTIGWPDGKILN